jgi:hypothetical protein
MLDPLLIQSHAFLIMQQDRRRDAERFRPAREPAPERPVRTTFAFPFRALANRLTVLAGLAHAPAGDHV